MSNDPAVITQPSTTDLISAAVTPIATQAATQAAQYLHQETLAITGGLQSDVAAVQAQVADLLAKQGPAIGQQAVIAIKSSLNNAAHDVWVPRGVIGIAGAFILIWAVFYFAGSHQAADLWVAVLPVLGTLGAVAGRMLLATATGAPSTTAHT